ncbi:hypothetical protein [Adlercreutzia sp. ZJ141]|uniref:hypothetical protein n=1 Tax=Adlercreutzia sp. ZJ141 TaxID=2709406 RepID=UPI0013EB73EE|nr:hypothetical protein [Adlercreutzia sp. ZJ141]
MATKALATFRAETLKGHRGAARKIAVLTPLPFCLLGMMAGGAFGGGAVGSFSTYGWNWWYSLMLPVACALITASIASIDARQKLKPVLGLPVQLARVWCAKVAYALVLVAGVNTVVYVASVATTLLGASAPSLLEGLATVAILTIASAWMVPVGLALTMRFGTLAGIAVPALLQIGVGISMWTGELWFLFPPATLLCAVAPFVGVEPSGIPLAAGDALGVFGWQAVAGIAVAALFFVVLSVAGAKWFEGRGAA